MFKSFLNKVKAFIPGSKTTKNESFEIENLQEYIKEAEKLNKKGQQVKTQELHIPKQITEPLDSTRIYQTPEKMFTTLSKYYVIEQRGILVAFGVNTIVFYCITSFKRLYSLKFDLSEKLLKS